MIQEENSDTSITRELIRTTLYSYLSTVGPADLVYLTPSNIRCNVLETQLNMELNEYKDFIKDILMKYVEENEHLNESKENDYDEDNEDDFVHHVEEDYDDDDESAKKQSGKGWSAPVQLSTSLAAFIGQTTCPRTEVTKLVWKYIKANNLQDPSDKRFIQCDAALQAVLNTRRIHMFSMTKELSKHMKSVADLNDDGTPPSKTKVQKVKVSSEKKRKIDDTDGAGSKKKGGGGGGFAKPMRPSEELRIFLGLEAGEGIGRTTCVKLMWDYIKANNLQNPNDRREILLDFQMQRVFGVKMFTMFTMNKHIAEHLTNL